MKLKYVLTLLLLSIIFYTGLMAKQKQDKKDKFKFETEQFADIKILRYQVPGFDKLNQKQKELVYYLYEAALAGRDIIWDQNYKHNLKIRKTLEAIIENYRGNRNSPEFKKFLTYAKRVFFSNGIHHHYSTAKIIPDFSPKYFTELIKNTKFNKNSNFRFPLDSQQTIYELIKELEPLIFDPNFDAKRVNQDEGVDLVANSACNFYENLTEKEVIEFYKSKKVENDPQPISLGLNSKLVKENGVIYEKVWKVGGMYSPAIEKIVYWLEKAIEVAENDLQRETLKKLVEYYQTGDLKKFNEYNILWVKDTLSFIDVVNGFIEDYGDPLGMKASFESVVSFKDLEATQRADKISKNAQWFEDNSPIHQEYKKKNVVGISAKVITVVVESGDASPSTPIGINLPNADWIRKEYGSKSVTLGNIVYAYDQSASEKLLKEFAFSKEEIERAKKYSSISNNLHTDLHEIIGHGSGQLKPGVAPPSETLKNYASVLEETRADLVALYYLLDKKLIEIGVMPDIEVGKTAYDYYIRNGLMLQLRRIKLGDNLEQAHMRNRQLISKWVYEKGLDDKVIEKKIKNGKTYFVINDYYKLRELFGRLLREVQRIKSEGDYEAGKYLVETYGVKIDQDLHKEVLERNAKLNIAPYSGFINPKLVPVIRDNKIVDVKIEYPEDFLEQMLYYGKNYSFLPVNN